MTIKEILQISLPFLTIVFLFVFVQFKTKPKKPKYIVRQPRNGDKIELLNEGAFYGFKGVVELLGTESKRIAFCIHGETSKLVCPSRKYAGVNVSPRLYKMIDTGHVFISE